MKKKQNLRKLEDRLDELTDQVIKHIDQEMQIIKILENHSEQIKTLQGASPALHPDLLELQGYY